MTFQWARDSWRERVTGPVHRSSSQRSRTRLLAGAVAVLAMVMASSALATTWTLMRTPRSPGSYLFGVSCTSPSACSAVGYKGVDSDTTLAERWNGHRWTIQSTPNPNALLSGVSCTSPNACIAVGRKGTGRKGSPIRALAERWNGRKWTPQSIPAPGGFALLSGVSCISADACTAVGERAIEPLVERWNGHKWAIQSIPRTADVSQHSTSGLSGVSCTSANACIAVGSTANGALAELWNGHKWMIQPTPSTTDGGQLDGVSCTSADVCIAVGDTNIMEPNGESGTATLAERWNGHRWTIQPTPRTTDGGQLNAASCTAENACIAVGDRNTVGSNGRSGTATLAERWNGHKWTIQSAPSLAASYGSLYGVSCASARACIASGNPNLAERYR